MVFLLTFASSCSFARWVFRVLATAETSYIHETGALARSRRTDLELFEDPIRYPCNFGIQGKEIHCMLG